MLLLGHVRGQVLLVQLGELFVREELLQTLELASAQQTRETIQVKERRGGGGRGSNRGNSSGWRGAGGNGWSGSSSGRLASDRFDAE